MGFFELARGLESLLTEETLRSVLNGGLAYGPYDVNRILLTSDPMPVNNLIVLLSRRVAWRSG